MGKNIDVSVILPSLNVVTYIRGCVESVLNQTLQNIEVICVDAGSTDGTLEILREYEKADKRIKVILSDKKSYGYQVNLGMKRAKGEYVAIVDTDDMISLDMYETLYGIAIEKDVDFVKADYREITQGDNGVLIKKVVPIVTDKGLYNRIINIAEEQQCFQPQITATWSGIYKRKFLEDNYILHNETKGASYQDTGFWFQTYVFATRAYFVNQPFYMYRIDNPNSSVSSKDKVFCICDEFDFVWKILEKKGLLEQYGNTFSHIFYLKYKRNLERIDKRYHLIFLRRFYDDFKKLEEGKILYTVLWSENERKDIQGILKNPQMYYTGILEEQKIFYERLMNFQQIIIYGAGRVGKIIYNNILNKENVISFAETNKQESNEYKGIPIRGLSELADYSETAQIVIAVKIPKYQEEMIKNAERCGFKKIVLLPGNAFDYE